MLYHVRPIGPLSEAMRLRVWRAIEKEKKHTLPRLRIQKSDDGRTRATVAMWRTCTMIDRRHGVA